MIALAELVMSVPLTPERRGLDIIDVDRNCIASGHTNLKTQCSGAGHRELAGSTGSEGCCEIEVRKVQFNPNRIEVDTTFIDDSRTAMSKLDTVGNCAVIECEFRRGLKMLW